MNKARFHEYLNRSHFYRFAEWLVMDHTRILMKGAGFGSLKSGMFLVADGFFGFLAVG
ncbi:MAG: hypothetical protein GY731_11650 [Gammaproteobacteria bacterium]|nr:hypothetical protein [Gammaproteobacteria bacterium]